MKKEFELVFQLSKLELFFVAYHAVFNNQIPYLALFIRNKKGFLSCGQCQDTALSNYQDAFDFYIKWDKLHLSDLTNAQYNDLVSDIIELKTKYNYTNDGSFESLVEFSKQKVK
mgnify:FL=1